MGLIAEGLLKYTSWQPEASYEELKRPFAGLDQHLAGRKYLIADRFTVADLNVAAVISGAQSRAAGPVPVAQPETLARQLPRTRSGIDGAQVEAIALPPRRRFPSAAAIHTGRGQRAILDAQPFLALQSRRESGTAIFCEPMSVRTKSLRLET